MAFPMATKYAAGAGHMPANWKPLYALVRGASPAWVVFAAGVAIAILACAVAQSRVERHAITKIDAAVNEARDAIDARLRSSYDVIYGMQGLFRASTHVTRQDFHAYIAGLNLAERHPGMRSVTYGELIPAERKS